jgi:membrane protein YdbS with pleckstrin-like domain
MNSEEQPQQQQEPEIPEDAIVVSQVQYAWLWSSWWLLAIVLGVALFTPAAEPTIGAFLAIIIVVPKFWQWRRTKYYLTEDTLIYQRGGIMQTRRYQIPLSRLTDTRARYGLFGRALGFQHVDIILDNGAQASLAYVPIQMDVVNYFRERIGSTPPDDPERTDGDSDAKPLSSDE